MFSNNRPLTIAIVAGETSGDVLGAGLIHALKARVPNVNFVGVAGPLMQKSGCEAWYQTEELAVMGIIEVLKDIRRLLRIRADLTNRLIKLKPDVFIGIDAPDFNLSIEGHLKKQGIKIIHYVSPSIWAWRQKRILTISQSTHMILVFLPFEKEFYNKFNVPCRFIGHAIADEIPLDPDKNTARDMLGIPYNVNCLAMLPGSRSMEIEMLSAIFLKATQILCHLCPNLNVVVPLVNTKCREQFKRIKTKVAPELIVHLLDVDGKGYEAMIASDAAMVASGTAALECMLAKCPMVICYRMKSFTYWLAKHLVKTKYISLPNLLAGYELVTELLQDKCQPQTIADTLLPILTNTQTNHEIRSIFRTLHQKIRCNANEQAADAVLDLIR